jgi:endonuclease YncB( thermonuclease family)
MFGRWRKTDGFTWVSYVPTQLVARRKARKERLKQAASDAQAAAKKAARKSAASVEKGVAQAGSAALAGGGHVARGLGDGLNKGMRRLGLMAQAGVQRLTSSNAAQQGASVSATVTRVLALAGIGAFLAVGIRLAITGTSQGLTGWPRIAVGIGIVAVLAALMPRLWHAIGPTIAGYALHALKTRRADDGGVPPARAGTIAVTVALAAAATVAAGWGAWRVTAAVLGGGPPISGVARVTGPQSLRIGETDIRLAGIAAPDEGQSCGEGNRKWRCGEDARRALSIIAASKALKCQMQGEDDTGIRLAQCFDGAIDIGATLVKGGHVWADRDNTSGYRTFEDAPRAAKIGIWKSASAPPWVQQDKVWEDAKRAAPDGCPVKGEVRGESSRAERIYHVPGGAAYARVRMGKAEVARGSRQWFCTEREARAANFKPAPTQR